MLVRREQPHPGAQLRFTDIDGYRYQVFVTDLPDADLAYLEALYRGRGRMECRIRDAKDTGLANLPSHDFTINTAWLTLVLIAADLLAWAKALCLQRRIGQRGAQTAALHPATHRRSARPLGAAHHAAAGRRLAMGHRPAHRVHPAARMGPGPRLTSPHHLHTPTATSATPPNHARRPTTIHHRPIPRIHAARSPTPTQRAQAREPSSGPPVRPTTASRAGLPKIRANA